MRAIIQPRYGGPDRVELADVPVPTPGAGQVLVRVGSTWRILQGALLGQYISSTSDMKLVILAGWPHSQRDMEDVNELIEAGSVRPVIDRTYVLAEAAEALR